MLNKKAWLIIAILFLLLTWFWTKSLVLLLFGLLLTDVVLIKTISGFLKKLLPKFVYISLRFIMLIAFPIGFAVFIRVFMLDIYVVPSGSMEGALFPEDRILVNKLAYGPKVPRYLCEIPLLNLLTKNCEFDSSQDYNLYRKINGYTSPQRNDIIVFQSTIRREKRFVKRLIGLPGDTIKLTNSVLSINGTTQTELSTFVFGYIDTTSTQAKLQYFSNSQLKNLPSVQRINLIRSISTVGKSRNILFPSSKNDKWSIDNYGPIYIPYIGMTIKINHLNQDFYSILIQRFESNTNINLDSVYAFKKNYYYFLGDNRQNSVDSRHFGLVPEEYILGKLRAKF